METYIPKVYVAKELREISKDFTRPEEMVREAIANSLDAGASKIGIFCSVTKTEYDEDELVVELADDGVGMNVDELKAFFDLGRSNKRANKKTIGEKGHGTKVFYNSSRVEVITKYLEDGKILKAILDDPIRKLNRAVKQGVDEPPSVEIEEIYEAGSFLEGLSSGTHIMIRGYNGNVFPTFRHMFLRDYIWWYTAWGSIRPILDIPTPECKLFLKGIDVGEPKEIPFGHPFPDVIYDFKKLESFDERRPENFYVRRWIFKDIPVIDYPHYRIDIVFSVEGDGAKRRHNEMLKWQGRPNNERYRGDDQYTVSDRYGVYLCKDYIPIQVNNEDFAERSEWTKWHAFINCQAFELTANRATVDNTFEKLLMKIINTAQNIITNEIILTDEYIDYAERAKIETGRRKAELEKKKVSRRIKSIKEKLKYSITKDGKTLNFLEPRTEQGIIWLISQLMAIWPGTFDWSVLDIDSHFGFDLLVERPHILTNSADHRFVECKYKLGIEEFNHSFSYLHQIICWETPLHDGEELEDDQHKKAVFQAYPKGQNNPYRRYFLDEGKQTRIEVIILKRFLEDCFKLSS